MAVQILTHDRILAELGFIFDMPCGRQRRGQRRVGNHRIQTRGQPAVNILKVSQQTSLSVPDQMYRTFTSGGYDGSMRRPGFDNDIAEPLDPAGANQNIKL